MLRRELGVVRYWPVEQHVRLDGQRRGERADGARPRVHLRRLEAGDGDVADVCLGGQLALAECGLAAPVDEAWQALGHGGRDAPVKLKWWRNDNSWAISLLSLLDCPQEKRARGLLRRDAREALESEEDPICPIKPISRHAAHARLARAAAA